MTQKKQILRYIDYFGSITPMQAFDLGITKLATRISEMRNKDGYKIKDKWEKGKNRFGEECNYKRYYFFDESEGK